MISSAFHIVETFDPRADGKGRSQRRRIIVVLEEHHRASASVGSAGDDAFD